MATLFVGIDVSKDSSAARGLGADGEERFSVVFAMDSGGFAQLFETITGHSADLSEVMVGLESTACYHINLFSFLTATGITAVVINPLLIANFSKLSLRKTKTDRKDALTIAQFLIAHKDSINQVAVSQDLQDFRDMAGERESVLYQSGKYEGTGRISKRGNRHLRRIIWLMTISVILHNPTFKTFFIKKRSEGRAYKKAVFATSHKLIRVLFTLLTKRTHFQGSCA